MTKDTSDPIETAATLKRRAMLRESLHRAENGSSLANEVAVIEGFMELGIDEDDILPRENVLTFNAWLAKGRVVMKGQHGVKITSWIPLARRPTDDPGAKPSLRPKTVTVFHISQTKEKDA